MSDPFGSSLFRVPVFLKEGTGVNLEQSGTDQALTINVDSDALADLLGSSTVSTDYQESVRVAATTNLNLLSTQTIDGVEVAVGDRVLATGQTSAADNRIWVVAAGAWTIADGWDVTDTITSGTLVPVEEGTTNAGKIAQLTTTGTITLGTTALAWTFLDTDDVFISNFIGRAVSAATTTMGLAYNKNWVYLTRNGVQTVTVPNNALAAHAIGTEIVVQMIGTGTKTIACGASVILNGAAAGTGSLTLTTSRDAYILKKRAINSWDAAPLKDPAGAYQPLDADLTTIAGLTATTDNFIVSVSSAWASRTPAQVKATLDLEIGTDVQAWDAFLDDIAALTDPNADRLMFWDDSAGDIVWLEAGSGLSISGTTLTANVSGKQTIYIPASAMLSATTSGAASAQLEMGTNKQNIGVLDFDATADEYAHFNVAFPKSWNLGTVTFQVFWTTSATDTDGVAWGLEAVARSDNEAIDASWGTAVVVTDDAQSAANEQYVTAESSAVTIAGTPADDDLVYFRLFRDVSDANDDMTEDARLIGIKLFYTTDANTDA